MLPAAARLRRREEFTTVFRSGRRIARGPLVVHLLRAGAGPDGSVPRAGFVIPATTGNAVARNRLRRRLRHLLRSRLDRLAGGALVVRALPGAADLSSAELARLLDSALPAPSGAAGGPGPSGGSPESARPGPSGLVGPGGDR